MSTQKRANPGQQLRQTEGLGDIVVGAGVESDHQVDLVCPGGEDQDRNLAAVCPDASADLEPINVRKAEVKHNHVGIVVGTFECGATVSTHVDLVALPPQSPRKRFRDRRIILCKKNTGHTNMVKTFAPISDRATPVSAFH